MGQNTFRQPFMGSKVPAELKIFENLKISVRDVTSQRVVRALVKNIPFETFSITYLLLFFLLTFNIVTERVIGEDRVKCM